MRRPSPLQPCRRAFPCSPPFIALRNAHPRYVVSIRRAPPCWPGLVSDLNRTAEASGGHFRSKSDGRVRRVSNNFRGWPRRRRGSECQILSTRSAGPRSDARLSDFLGNNLLRRNCFQSGLKLLPEIWEMLLATGLRAGNHVQPALAKHVDQLRKLPR